MLWIWRKITSRNWKRYWLIIPGIRDNFIRKGDEYELYCLDKEWVSLEVKVAEADSLVYGNVPSG
ncbi:MAG: hypothetical protein AB2L24_31800 [Mangrovibacterium sp.]